MSRKELAQLFPRTDPAEVELALLRAAERLNLRGDSLERADVLALLEEMTRADGAGGVAARFAKARAILMLKPAHPAARLAARSPGARLTRPARRR
jgi:hypothetical protein